MVYPIGRQFDMTAWVKKNTREEVGIMTAFVDPAYDDSFATAGRRLTIF